MKEEIKCPQCNGNRLTVFGNNSYKCSYCGTTFNVKNSEQEKSLDTANSSSNVTVQINLDQGQLKNNFEQQCQPRKSRTTAGILALLLGGFGIHKFYLGKAVGILYLLFCWTYIPSIISFIEGISYLCMSDRDFYNKFG